MADYVVKFQIVGPDKSKTITKTRKVQASSWGEAKKKVKSEVERDRGRVARNFSELDPKPRISYKNSTVDTKARNKKTGIIRRITTSDAKSGKEISQRNFGNMRSAKAGGGRMVGASPARRVRNAGGIGQFKMPDVLDLKNL